MSKLKQFIYENNNRKFYYLAEKEYCDLEDIHDQIWHREEGPAYIRYYKDGSIEYEHYFINNKWHREDGPAWIRYYLDGSIEYEAYYINGKRHREDGPARIWYNKDGNIYGEVYWLDNNEYTKDEYDRELRRRNTKIGRELYE